MNLKIHPSNLIPVLGSLSKVRITLPVTASTLTGFVVFHGNFSLSLLPLLSGIFLLAAGSSAFNHYQERNTDALMERTKSRPIPGGLVSGEFVLAFSVISAIAGSLILLLTFPVKVVGLGLLTLFWYNAVYTPLKKVTAFAVIPGALTGGVPPLIGWVAAGGHWLETEIVAIVLFFVIGQIPHFWLLLLKYGKEYEQAGLPSLTSIFSNIQIRRISYAWVVAVIAASSLLPACNLISCKVLLVIYFLSLVILILAMMFLNLTGTDGKNPETVAFPPGTGGITSASPSPAGERYVQRIMFTALNTFYLLIMILLMANSLLACGQ